MGPSNHHSGLTKGEIPLLLQLWWTFADKNAHTNRRKYYTTLKKLRLQVVRCHSLNMKIWSTLGQYLFQTKKFKKTTKQGRCSQRCSLYILGGNMVYVVTNTKTKPESMW